MHAGAESNTKSRLHLYESGAAMDPVRAREPVRDLLHRRMLDPSDLVMPLLVRDPGSDDNGEGVLPTVGLDGISEEVKELYELGIKGVDIFAPATRKDAQASESLSDDSLMIRAIEAVKESVPKMSVSVETCLCSYTETGNCYLMNEDGTVDVSGTRSTTAESAILQAKAGADILGPSGMVLGNVRAVRASLDDTGFGDVAIMPHLIFDSSLFGEYRSTMKAHPREGHRRSLQIHPSYPEQAVERAEMFLDEGASMILLEPALSLTDVLGLLRSRLRCPILAFSVSGEYKLLKSQGPAVAEEVLSSYRRAGADLIVTYMAKETAQRLRHAVS